MTDRSDGGFLRHLCDFRPQIRILLAACGLFFLLSLVSLVVVSPGTPAYAVTLLNVAGLLVFSTLFSGVLLLCRKREPT